MRRGLVVVITGAGSGIGRSTARRFARAGARLVLGDIDELAVRAVAEEVGEAGNGEAAALLCDVRREGDVRALVEAAVARYGRLDVMVSNAGKGYYARIEDTPADDLRDLLEVNLLGVHHGLLAATAVMRPQESGHIVVIGSINGRQSWPFHGAYSATKFAVTGLVQAARMELAGSGVTVSLILPVSTETQFFSSAQVRGNYQPRPMGIRHTPDAVAKKILRTVDHPSPEVNMVPAMRVTNVMGDAVPWLADWAGKWWYRRVWRRIGHNGEEGD
jgi:NAD(P)-dependent dehydrogenase (short-subunit alcohol dehydrogenase family)